ncbi:MAG: hypothetical protein K5865_06240 [Eubacterium sp.]|nr:hypothetical protein [Eubacterium sp.]
MLNEEKIRLMTKVAIYEKNEELSDLALSRFYKEDYVKYGCLKTLVATTFCYWMCIGVYVLLNFEQVLNNLNEMDYFKVITKLMMGYVIAMVIFYIYGFLVYNYKFMKARPRLLRYNRDLKKLIKVYEKEEAQDQIKRGKIKVYSEIGGFDDMPDFFKDGGEQNDSVNQS